jgi:hypothetical protein
VNIFADFHHPALYYSLYLLFEKRLGHKLFRPIGVDWLNKGYWKITNLCVNNYQTSEKLKECLIPNAKLPYADESQNKIKNKTKMFYIIEESGAVPVTQRAVTLNQFKRMRFDLIISSFVDNIAPFKALSKEYQDNIKVIAQVGNVLWQDKCFEDVPVIASILPSKDYNVKEIVFYKQEIDTDIFFPFDGAPDNTLSSFVYSMNAFTDDMLDFQLIEKHLSPKYRFHCYGKESRDGYLTTQKEIANIMRKSRFGINLKTIGDGFGHVIHNWFAVGRPTIFRKSHYEGKLGGLLLEHLQTGLDLDAIGIDNCIDIINNISEEDYNLMCANVKKRFKENMDFEEEGEKVRRFLERIL